MHTMVAHRHVRIARTTVLRLCREEKLPVPRRRKLKPAREIIRTPMVTAQRPGQGWALDFTHEQIVSGATSRILTNIDEFTREILLTVAAASFKATDVRAHLRATIEAAGQPPQWLRSDNGSEFVAELSAAFLNARNIQHIRSRPGTPTDNPMIESFHSRFRDELLDRTLFSPIPDANSKLTAFRRYCNHTRLHSSLRYLTPAAFHSRHLGLQFQVAQ